MVNGLILELSISKYFIRPPHLTRAHVYSKCACFLERPIIFKRYIDDLKTEISDIYSETVNKHVVTIYRTCYEK